MSPRPGLDLQTILKTATKLADTNGLEAVTLATLATTLQVKSPSLYNHVKGLQVLKIEMAKYGYRQLNDQLAEAAIGRSQDAAVHHLGKRYVSFVRSHPGLYEAMLRAPRAADEELEAIQSRSIQIVLQVMNEYKLGEEETLHAVRGLRSILHGFASLEQNGEFGLPLKLDISLALALNAYLAGIKALNDINSSLRGS
ncbi:WHG domain-containing protein [Niallia taxi]|uniref:TetR/AcrR family transcriptional regulator n=1 Tax=Niallia taxi TaxID=2499688 RepID=UPI002934F402|nr:WHG domain-containing protein [Niallia taxi]WOD61312.1 WHG domain-containing protein [Niallia taxi]